MASNITDEDEISYPVFNEDPDIVMPVFQLGMCFKDSRTFREAVKIQVIFDRRPITNFRNFGKKIKYICEAPYK